MHSRSIVLGALGILWLSPLPHAQAQDRSGNLEAFVSDAEFASWLRQALRRTRRSEGLMTRAQAMRCPEEEDRLRGRGEGGWGYGTIGAAEMSVSGYGAGAPAGPSPPSAPSPSVSPARARSMAPPANGYGHAEALGQPGESITNTQEADVDEGAIVKVHGDHFVVLRRGRVFTVSLRNGELRAVDAINAFAPGSRVDEYGAWYDEMLVHDDTVVVIGFRYQEMAYGNEQGATEVGLFHIDNDGHLRHRRTFYLRSNDYYSSRNYASRLIGDQLIFYMPFPLLVERYSRCGNAYLASTRPATNGRFRAGGWDSVLRATEVFRPQAELERPTLHTVVTCDLGREDTPCAAKGVVGSEGRNFYVSGSAVYVWTETASLSADDDAEMPSAMLYRLPLQGPGAGVVPVEGMPTDQFSFHETTDHLDVLVRSESQGDRMWGPEMSAGDLFLVGVPLSSFRAAWRITDERRQFPERNGAMPASYRALQRPSDGDAFQNRFVGDHVLYGTGTSWGRPGQYANHGVFVHSLEDHSTTEVRIGHGVDRIDLLGSDAIVIGANANDLHFTSIGLSDSPSVLGSYVRRNASQGELRSQGFFFKPTGTATGIVGLPVRGGGRPGYEHLVRDSASVLFLSVDRGRFQEFGSLWANAAAIADHCVASCVDWYGNARPIFYQNRIFALLGYELVEGVRLDREIDERQRVNFASVLERPRRRATTVVAPD